MTRIYSFLTIIMIVSQMVNAQKQQNHHAQESMPIPIGIMHGHNSSMYQMILKKTIRDTKFGYFNLTEYQVDFDDKTPDNYLSQSIFTYEILKGFELGAGASFKSFGGFKPIVSMSYSKFGKNFGFVIQPSYEIHKDGLAEVFSLFQWLPQNNKLIQPYVSLQTLSSFKNKHVYSYQYLWAGIQYKSLQFGPAFNFEQIGSNFETHSNIGAFITINI